jgi:hypothetical protein
MNDLELELLAYLGTDFAQSVSAELGQEVVELIFCAGARAQLEIDERILSEITPKPTIV